MLALAVRGGQLAQRPVFPERLVENGPRQGFFEHAEYEAVRRYLPPPYQDVLDFAYYSGWRKREILALAWCEVDAAGGIVRLSPERSKTRVGRVLPMSAPIRSVLTRRHVLRRAQDPRVFRRDAVTVRAWRAAWPEACRRAGVPGRLLHDCRRTAARNLVRAGVPERVAMLLTGHRSRPFWTATTSCRKPSCITPVIGSVPIWRVRRRCTPRQCVDEAPRDASRSLAHLSGAVKKAHPCMEAGICYGCGIRHSIRH